MSDSVSWSLAGGSGARARTGESRAASSVIDKKLRSEGMMIDVDATTRLVRGVYCRS